MQGMQRKTWAWMLASHLWACMLLVFSSPAHAQRTEGDRAAASGPYEAEVAVRNQGESERNAAFGRALSAVLAKVTGDRGAAQRPGVRDELGKARDYVAGYDYRQDEGVSASGAPSFQTTLVARFKRDDVDQLIQMLGMPSWPMPRPKPVLWLAITGGPGPRLNPAAGSFSNSPADSRWACPAAMPRSRPRWVRSGAATPPPSPACRASTARRCN